jgi:hypothetical protein
MLRKADRRTNRYYIIIKKSNSVRSKIHLLNVSQILKKEISLFRLISGNRNNERGIIKMKILFYRPFRHRRS